MIALTTILPIVKRLWWAVPIIALTIALMFTRHTLEKRTGELKRAQVEVIQVKSAWQHTIANYNYAADLATKAAAANVARVKAEQAAISKDQTNALQADLASTTVRFDRLSRQVAAATHPGGSKGAGLPAAGNPACFADGTPCTTAVLATLKDAEDNTNQLVALIAWNKAQAAIVNTP